MNYTKKIAVIAVLTIISFFINSCTNIYRILVYQKPGIEDYKIFQNRIIKSGNHRAWEVDKNYNRKVIPDIYRPVFNQYETIAYLIIQNGKIKYEEYWDGFDENSISNSFSAAKSIVSLLVGIAIDEGKIKSIDQKVCDFIPEFCKGRNADLTIKDLLTMSSGLNWKESYNGAFSKTTKAYYGTNLNKQILKLKVTEEPGETFTYQSSDTQILSFILEKATGMNMSDYASEKLWKQIGAKNDALWNLDKKDGNEKAYCCFNSNARDFARIGQLCLNKGMWNGKQIISESYLNDAFTPASYLKDDDNKPVNFYGYHWWIINYKDFYIPYARGILGQYIFIIPEKNAVVVRLGHKRSKDRINNTPIDAFTWIDSALEILD